MQKYLITCGLLWLTILLSAQPLDQLRQEVEAHNAELQALQQAYLAALERIPQVGQLPQPQVGVSTLPLPVETRLGPQQLRLSAGQSFPWFGTLQQQKLVETTKAERINEQIHLQRQQLFFQLDEAYLKFQQLEKEQQIQAMHLALLAGREQLALAKLENGQGTTADVLRIQLLQEQQQQQLHILEQLKTTPQAVINQLRHKAAAHTVLIVDSLRFAVLPWAKEALLQQLKQAHPMLRQYALGQEMVQQKRQLNTLQQKPSFAIGVDYIAVAERQNATITDNGRDILLLSAKVTIPLYRQAYRASQREQEFELQRIQYQKMALQDQFASIVEEAYAQHTTARLELELYDKQIKLTQHLIALLESSYAVGNSSLDELLHHEQNLIDYQRKKLAAIVKSHQAKNNLQQLVY